jgi:hypothetical protein
MATTMQEMAAQPGTKSTPHRRRFRLVDVTILVAATGLGCALVRGLSAVTDGECSWGTLYETVGELPRDLRSMGWIWPAIDLCYLLMALALPFLAMLTLALIPIRLLGPRPRWRHLARQPGIMAAFASALAIASIDLPCIAVLLHSIEENARPKFDSDIYIIVLSISIGLAVMVSWMTLFVGRGWRAERSWVDRLGRGAGVVWIGSCFLSVALLVLAKASGDRPLPPYTPTAGLAVGPYPFGRTILCPPGRRTARIVERGQPPATGPLRETSKRA